MTRRPAAPHARRTTTSPWITDMKTRIPTLLTATLTLALAAAFVIALS